MTEPREGTPRGPRGKTRDLPRRAAGLAALLAELDDELDWERLGALYCHEGGEAFFPREQRAAMRDAGLAFAADLGERLSHGGASHYLGAAVAELVPILFEATVLDRRVHWTLLEGGELDELRRALSRVAESAGLALPLPVPPAPASAPIDHLWCASVLTDPEAFPALHDELYGRRGDPLGTGRGDPAGERERAEVLVAEAVTALAPPALISTTDEELAFFEAACRARGWRVEVPAEGRLSGVVGDVVRHARVVG